jgi:hypothetical protein
MTQIQPFIDTNSSSSSSPSGTNFPVNSELNELAGQVASLLNVGQLHSTLGLITEHLKFLTQKVGQKFGETEKPFPLSLDPEPKEKHNLSINSTNPIILKSPSVFSKDSQKLQEKVVGRIKKDAKRRESPPASRKVFIELTGSNDLIS